MLLKCPECELQVSDKAVSCPHCGYPMMKGTSKEKSTRKKRMRLPNGFGQITKLNNQHLRKPYRAMITVGIHENGRPIVELLRPQAYFATYNEAYEALIEYHKHPADVDSGVTVAEVYERWSTEYFKTLTSQSSYRTIEAAWAYCSSAYQLPIKEVRARHIKYCLEEGYIIDKNGDKKLPSANTKSRMKSVWNLLMDYALEYELTDRNYARTFDLSKDIVKERDDAVRGHKTYSVQEMQLIEKNINEPIGFMLMVQCYMGWRPQELCLLRNDNVDLDKMLIVGGMKTEAGSNRIVPIPEFLQDRIRKQKAASLTAESEYLFYDTSERTGKISRLTYDKYSYRFEKFRDTVGLDPEHRPHDGRKQFVTLAKKAGVDEYAIKRIVGHRISDITEKVYTDRDIEWLREEMQKIKH